MEKDVFKAYMLLAFSIIGFAGLQHFYLNKPIKGFIWFFTCGLMFVGTFYDLITMEDQVKEYNESENAKWGGL